MKKNELRLLEEKLRYVAMEDIGPEPERRQQMLARAKAAVMQQSPEADMKPSRRHGIGRRVIIVSAAAMLVLVLSFGFAVLTPESVSHAKGFVRTAAIWVNNTLHLGYEFEEPMEKPEQLPEDASYDSIEIAAANIPYPLVYLDDPSFELQSVTTQSSSTVMRVTMVYQNEAQEYRIVLEPAAESSITSFNDETHTVVPWQHGELECWENVASHHALTYYQGLEININSVDIAYDDFLALCQSLKALN